MYYIILPRKLKSSAFEFDSTVFHPVTLENPTFEFAAYVFYPVTLESIPSDSRLGGRGERGVVRPIIFQITPKSVSKYDHHLPLCQYYNRTPKPVILDYTIILLLGPLPRHHHGIVLGQFV